MSEEKSREKDKKKRRELPPIRDDVWNNINGIRKEFKITWGDLFERFYNYQDWFAHLLRLPKEPSKGDRLNVTTTHFYMSLWLENVYKNFIKEHIKDLPDVRSIIGIAKDRPAILIGAGPSLKENNYLELLANSDFKQKGKIIAVSHILDDCLNAGVIPDYITLVDPEPMMIDHINTDIVDKYASEITGIFPITIHPDVLQRWKGKKLFFLAGIPETTIPNVQAVMSGLFPKITELSGCSNAGTFSFLMGWQMGCNPIAMIGMDMSFMPDTPIEETPYYKAFRPAYKTEKEMIAECYRFHTHSFFQNNCYTDDIYYQFALGITDLAKQTKEANGATLINCTGRGIIDEPDIIENMWFEDFLKKNEVNYGGGGKNANKKS